VLRIALLALLLLPAAARAGEEKGPSPERTGPRLTTPSPYTGWLLRDARLRLRAEEERKEKEAPALSPSTLSFNRLGAYPVESLYRPRIYRLSRYQSTMKGLGAGARTGLFMGILANVLAGSDDYRSAWYAAGAAAAAGAILGGTVGNDDPDWRRGIDWSIDVRPGEGRLE